MMQYMVMLMSVARPVLKQLNTAAGRLRAAEQAGRLRYIACPSDPWDGFAIRGI